MNVYRAALTARITMTSQEVVGVNQRDDVFSGITIYSEKDGMFVEAIFLAENDETAHSFFGSNALDASRVPAGYESVLTLERGSFYVNGVFHPQELLGEESGF